MIKWLYDQVGADVAGWAIPYLRTHTPDGGEASSALLPNEDLTALNESSLAAIRKDMAGFLARLKDYAAVNSASAAVKEQIVSAGEKKIEVPQEGEYVAIGKLESVTVKVGVTNKKQWVLYEIKLAATDFFTFSKSVGEVAKAVQGQEVALFYVPNEKGNTATAIEVGGKVTRAGESKDK
jgi:hypothetical protein